MGRFTLDTTLFTHEFRYPSVHAFSGICQRNIQPWISLDKYRDWGSPHDRSKMHERCDQTFFAVFNAPSSAFAVLDGVVTPNMQFHASSIAQSKYRPHRSCFGNTAIALGGGASS